MASIVRSTDAVERVNAAFGDDLARLRERVEAAGLEFFPRREPLRVGGR